MCAGCSYDPLSGAPIDFVKILVFVSPAKQKARHRRRYFRRRRRQHFRLKFAWSNSYGLNSNTVQPMVLKLDSNDSVECSLSYASPYSVFRPGIGI